MKAGKPEVFLQTPASELYPAFSPDGRWIAYRSNESGADEVYVRAFPDKGGKWLISNSGGVLAVWSRNRRELFYRTPDQHIMVVAYTVKGDVFVADNLACGPRSGWPTPPSSVGTLTLSRMESVSWP
jgi:Tol biopolymer transport system component